MVSNGCLDHPETCQVRHSREAMLRTPRYAGQPELAFVGSRPFLMAEARSVTWSRWTEGHPCSDLTMGFLRWSELLDRLAVSAFVGLALTAVVVLTSRIAGLFGG
jgi:hypothetical protein